VSPAVAHALLLLLLLLLGQGLEGCEPVVLIVDDSSAVWPNDRRNLFIVERYIYFPSSRRRLGMAGKSLMEVDRCVRGARSC
jgi:RNA polymerase II C-terminal domain phosphatase-like 3/4